jgi:D-serine deaminase-like pyridoxal phosphate-dependent protein
VREAGLDVRMVSSGGTPNVANLGRIKGATEHRAGTYVFNDRMMLACGAARHGRSRASRRRDDRQPAGPERGIVDAGSKTLTSDTGGLEGHGLILEHPRPRSRSSPRSTASST